MIAVLTLGLLERDRGLVCSLVMLVYELWSLWLISRINTHTWLLVWTVCHVLNVMIQEIRVSKHVTLDSVGTCLSMRPPGVLITRTRGLVLGLHVLFVFFILWGLQQWDGTSNLPLRATVLVSM